jgi:hypothetical protein
MLGFSHIAWALIQVTKVDDRAKFMWGKEKQRAFDDMTHHLSSTSILSFLNMKQPFDIENNAYDYVVGPVLTQHSHLVAQHSETLLDTVHKYPNYDKEKYSIVQSCRQWKHYIMGKEMIIHIDHKPL